MVEYRTLNIQTFTSRSWVFLFQVFRSNLSSVSEFISVSIFMIILTGTRGLRFYSICSLPSSDSSIIIVLLSTTGSHSVVIPRIISSRSRNFVKLYFSLVPWNCDASFDWFHGVVSPRSWGITFTVISSLTSANLSSMKSTITIVICTRTRRVLSPDTSSLGSSNFGPGSWPFEIGVVVARARS